MNLIVDTLRAHIPSARETPNGWLSFNCPCCHHLGHRPDTRKRGGILFENSGFRYNCFNCGFATKWQAGTFLSRKTLDLFEYLNIPDNLIGDIKLESLKDFDEVEGKREKRIFSLPTDACPISELVNNGFMTDEFAKVLTYINNRNEHFFEYFDFFYSPSSPLSFIIPISHNGIVIGYTQRNIQGKPKYYSQMSKDFLFNADTLHEKHRKYCLIVEGPLDAISIDGVAVFGNMITEGQRNLLDNSPQQKIVVPDKDEAGKYLVRFAIEYNYKVSFPEWECKDMADAVAKYGRVPALVHILNNVYDGEAAAKIKAEEYFRRKT